MTTPAPSRSPASRVTVFRSPTAAPRACSATEASTASFSTRTIGTHDESSPTRSGFIRAQKPSRCTGERPAESTGAGTPDAHRQHVGARDPRLGQGGVDRLHDEHRRRRRPSRRRPRPARCGWRAGVPRRSATVVTRWPWPASTPTTTAASARSSNRRDGRPLR